MDLPDGLSDVVNNFCTKFALPRWMCQCDDTLPEPGKGVKPFVEACSWYGTTNSDNNSKFDSSGNNDNFPTPTYLDQMVKIRPPLGPRYLYSLNELLKPRKTLESEKSKLHKETEKQKEEEDEETKHQRQLIEWKAMASNCIGQSFTVPPQLARMATEKATSSILHEVLTSCPIPCDGVTSAKGSLIEPLVALFDCGVRHWEANEHRPPRRLTVQDLTDVRFNKLIAALGKHPDVNLPYLALDAKALSEEGLRNLFQLKTTGSPGQDPDPTPLTGEKWALQDTVVELNAESSKGILALCITALLTGQVKDVRWSKYVTVLDAIRAHRPQKQQPNPNVLSIVASPRNRPRHDEEGSRLVVFKLSDGTRSLACPLKVLQRFSKFPLFQEADDDLHSDPIELPVETTTVAPQALRFVLSHLASPDCFFDKEIEYFSDMENVKQLFTTKKSKETAKKRTTNSGMITLPYILCEHHRPLLEPLGFPIQDCAVSFTQQQMHTILAVLRVCEFFDIPFIGNLVLMALALYLFRYGLR